MRRTKCLAPHSVFMVYGMGIATGQAGGEGGVYICGSAETYKRAHSQKLREGGVGLGGVACVLTRRLCMGALS